jgi:exopolysaccharide biosynthesis polyprenyl glycosylphosphotransferase
LRLVTPAVDRLRQEVAPDQHRRALAYAIPTGVQHKLLVAGLVLLDAATLTLAFGAAYWVRFELSIPIFRLEIIPTKAFYLEVVAILLPIWLVFFAIAGLYRLDNLLGGTLEYSLLFRTITIGFLVVIVAGFVAELIIARGWMLVAWALCFLFCAIGRFTMRRVVYFLRARGLFLSRAVIVGANAEGKSIAQQLLSWRTSGLDVVGFIDDSPSPDSYLRRVPVLGKLPDLEKTVQENQVTEIILATSALDRETMLDIFQRFGVMQGVNLRMSSGLLEVITTGLNVKEFAYVPLVGVNKVRLTGADQFLKAALDYSLGLTTLLFVLPAIAVISIAIKLDSPGPVIYRRRVLGVNGKAFDAFKFRTMSIDSDRILDEDPDLRVELSRNHKLKIDPRITRVGSILRRYSLDELPQIINVLFGEMSLVGPRMISEVEVNMYDQWAMNLLTVKPGMTGLWQVSGRSDLAYDDRVRLDMHYVRNWTIWLDLQILLQTLPAVLQGVGAY